MTIPVYSTVPVQQYTILSYEYCTVAVPAWDLYGIYGIYMMGCEDFMHWEGHRENEMKGWDPIPLPVSHPTTKY